MKYNKNQIRKQNMQKVSSYLKIDIVKELNEFMRDLSQKQDDVIRTSYKRVCAQLVYISKVCNFLVDTSINFLQLLAHWVEVIIEFLESQQNHDGIQRFPLFSFIVGRFRQITTKSNPKNSSPQSPSKPPNLSPPPLKPQQTHPSLLSHYLQSLSQQNINKQLKNIVTNIFSPQSNACVCCSRVFVRNFHIKNQNSNIRVVLPLNKFQLDKQNMGNYSISTVFNAVCNAGGGVVIFGAEKKDGVVRVAGLVFKNLGEIRQKQMELKGILDLIKPACNYRIDSVLVIDQNDIQIDIKDNHKRFCLRVMLKPHKTTHISYMQPQIKLNENNKQIYVLNRTQEAQKLYGTAIYKKIHGLYKNGKNIQYTNNHRNIKCFQALDNMGCCRISVDGGVGGEVSVDEVSVGDFSVGEGLEGEVDKYGSKDDIDNVSHDVKVDKGNQILQTQKPPKTHQKKQNEKSLTSATHPNTHPITHPNNDYHQNIQLPNLKYSKQSLLIVGSQNQDKFIIHFINFIKQQHIVQANHLYPKVFVTCSRSVWIVSHQINYHQIKDLLRDFSQKELGKKQPITAMPVHTILQIQQQKLTQYIEQYLQAKLNQNFPLQPQQPTLQKNQLSSTSTSTIPSQNTVSSSSSSSISISSTMIITPNEHYIKCKSQYYDHKHKESKKIYYLKFDDIYKALFAYMCFETQQLRPYFVSLKDCKGKF